MNQADEFDLKNRKLIETHVAHIVSRHQPAVSAFTGVTWSPKAIAESLAIAIRNALKECIQTQKYNKKFYYYGWGCDISLHDTAEWEIELFPADGGLVIPVQNVPDQVVEDFTEYLKQ